MTVFNEDAYFAPVNVRPAFDKVELFDNELTTQSFESYSVTNVLSPTFYGVRVPIDVLKATENVKKASLFCAKKP